MATPNVPAEVGLFGLGFYTYSLIDLCRSASMKVKFVVDDLPEDQPGFDPRAVNLPELRQNIEALGIRVVPQRWIIQQFQQQASLPPLIASRIENQIGVSFSSDPFLRNGRLVRDVSGGKVHLYHPVSLGEVVPLTPYRKRVALYGFQGSGNILAQHLLCELLKLHKDPVPTSQVLMASFAEHYFVSTTILLTRLLACLRASRFDFTPSEYPTMDVTFVLPGEGGGVLFGNVPSNRHYGQFFYHTHGMPTQRAVEEIARLGGCNVAILRYPCETLLSMASKFSRPPTPLLNCPRWMGTTLRKFAEWNRQLIANKDRITVVRYEDLILRDRKPVHAMADRLGVQISDSEIDVLFDRYLHRDLLPGNHPGHYYRGGTDKWKQHFYPGHVNLMLAQGFEAICKQWGYEVPDPASCHNQTEIDLTDGASSGQIMGGLTVEQLQKMTDLTLSTSGPLPYLLRAPSPQIRTMLLTHLEGPEFYEHLVSGGLGAESPPWVTTLPWQEMARTLYPRFFAEEAVAKSSVRAA